MTIDAAAVRVIILHASSASSCCHSSTQSMHERSTRGSLTAPSDRLTVVELVRPYSIRRNVNRFVVNPDLDSLANRTVWIRERGRLWRQRSSFTLVMLVWCHLLPVSLVNPRQNRTRESGFGFAHWTDGFTESSPDPDSGSANRIRSKTRTSSPELSVGPFCVTQPNPIQLTTERTVY